VLTPGSEAVLEARVFSALTSNPQIRIEIAGYTDQRRRSEEQPAALPPSCRGGQLMARTQKGLQRRASLPSAWEHVTPWPRIRRRKDVRGTDGLSFMHASLLHGGYYSIGDSLIVSSFFRTFDVEFSVFRS